MKRNKLMPSLLTLTAYMGLFVGFAHAGSLSFSQQPTDAIPGDAIASFTVEVLDDAGNLDPGGTAAVTLSIDNNPGGSSISGTNPVNAIAGVATFADISLDQAGVGYTLGASAAGLTSATSSSFNINTAPVLDTTGDPAMTAISENITPADNTGDQIADIIADLGGDGITDPDPGQEMGIAVNGVEHTYDIDGNPITFGTWQYSSDGSDWHAISNSVSDNAALLLTPTYYIRFVPDGGYEGDGTETFTFRAWDQTIGSSGGVFSCSDNGGATSFSSATETVTLTVVKGDLNNDLVVDLEDAVIGLKILVGVDPGVSVSTAHDVNGDGVIGIEEVIYILQVVGAVRT